MRRIIRVLAMAVANFPPVAMLLVLLRLCVRNPLVGFRTKIQRWRWSSGAPFVPRIRWSFFSMLVLTIVGTVLSGYAVPICAKTAGLFAGDWNTQHGIYLGAVAAATKAPPKLPFRYGTVQRSQQIGSYTFTPGQQLPAVKIPQVGMLASVLVNVYGTYTKANATGTNLYDGYDAFLARAQVNVNNGSANIVDVSGVGVSIINKADSPSLPIKRGLVTSAGAQTYGYKFILPVNANQRRQFEMGLINLQAPELQATISLSFNPLSSIFATAADVSNFVGNVNLSYTYYEIPDINRYSMPPITVVRTLEEAPASIAAVGDQKYTVPRLGTMIDYHGVVVLNNLYTTVRTTMSNVKLRYNLSDTQVDRNIEDQETYEARVYGYASPTTTFLDNSTISFPLWAAGDKQVNGGDFRDAIDTEENTTTDIILTVAAGTGLNAGKDNIFHVRRVVQRVVPAPAPTA